MKGRRSLTVALILALVATACANDSGVDATSSGTADGAADAGSDEPGRDSPGDDGVGMTGMDDATLRIGVHAPVTGAAPIPVEDFRRALNLYWDFIDERDGGVHGRSVEVVFRDDEFSASNAVRVCRELVEREDVFLLVGGAGTDTIPACAAYANDVGVPYVSQGSADVGLRDLDTYFAISQSYADQSALLADIAAEHSATGKVGMVVLDSPLLSSARQAMATELETHDELELVHDQLLSKGASQAETLTMAQQLKDSGADVVYALVPATLLIPLTKGAHEQAYDPTWIGPGLSNGVNLAAAAGCPAIDGAIYLSPFPQLDVIDEIDPDYREQYRDRLGAEPDDLGLALWGLNKAVHQMLLAAGPDLTRDGFIQTAESGEVFKTGVFPEFSFGPDNRFGASTSNVLVADCAQSMWTTAELFLTAG